MCPAPPRCPQRVAVNCLLSVTLCGAGVRTYPQPWDEGPGVPSGLGLSHVNTGAFRSVRSYPLGSGGVVLGVWRLPCHTPGTDCSRRWEWPLLVAFVCPSQRRDALL